jgi:hypothetical protein
MKTRLQVLFYALVAIGSVIVVAAATGCVKPATAPTPNTTPDSPPVAIVVCPPNSRLQLKHFEPGEGNTPYERVVVWCQPGPRRLPMVDQP